MEQNLEQIIEEMAFHALKKNSPNLLKIIETFVRHGFDSEQILEICIERSGQPRHRLAFIACAADYIINNPSLITETPQ